LSKLKTNSFPWADFRESAGVQALILPNVVHVVPRATVAAAALVLVLVLVIVIVVPVELDTGCLMLAAQDSIKTNE
jgi:hypothetical protein